jgi:translocation and assembly module TamB
LSQTDQTPSKPPPRPRPRLHHSLLGELAFVVAVLLAIVVGVRFGPLTEPGRAVVTAYLDGQSLGQWGRLHVEGLQGDIWSDFTIGRLSVSDPHGVWLDVERLRVTWRMSELIRRRFHAQAVSAARVRLFRRPLLGPPPPGGQAPLSLIIDRMTLRLESRPELSVRPGLFDITASLDADRGGGLGGAIKAQSLLRAGDGLDARFELFLTKRLFIDARAREGVGGAIAGALGLPADQSFGLNAQADGDRSEGQFHLRVASGAQTPARVDGVWTKTGGSAKANLSLAASSLTAPFARAIGPEVEITVKGQGADRGLLTLAGAIQAENLSATAAGLIDRDRLTAPKGLRVSATIKDLTRIVATPAMGGGAFNGTLIGALADWRLTGAVGVDRIGIDGYTLARADGPISLGLAKRELRLQANLIGQGGAGRGLLAALAGPSPRASLQASRLADGRLLVRALSADGAGLGLTAAGDRNLFGGLSLKGALRLSNLSAAQAGAGGQIDARWSASQARASAPWRLALDAQAQALATGYAEIDRLLGSKPMLAAQADYGQGVITVSDARLSGAAAGVGAKGLVGPDGALKLSLDWTAQGPFEAGPVEIAGKASGAGAITGSWTAPRALLLANFERIDLPSLSLTPAHVVVLFARTAAADTDGMITVDAGGEYGPARAKAGFHLVDGGVELKDVDAVAGGLAVRGSLNLRKTSPPLADLTASLGPGAFASAGSANARIQILDAVGGPVGLVRISAEGLVPRGSGLLVQSARATGEGPLSRLPFTVNAQVIDNGTPIRFTGSGVGAQSGQVLTVSLDASGQMRKAEFHTLSPAQFTFAGPEISSRLSLSLGGGHAEISTRQDGESASAKGVLTGVDLAALNEGVVGKFNADFSLGGRGADLQGALNARLTGARSRDAVSTQALEGSVNASLAGQRLVFDASGGGSNGGGRATVHVVLPAEAAAAPFRIAVDRTRPIEGRFDADSELQPIWDLFFGGEYALGGRLVAHGALAGSLNDPVVTGQAELTGGRLEDAATGLKLRNLSASVDLKQNVVNVRAFSATDTKAGTVAGEGRLSLIRGGDSTLTLNVHGFQLLDNDAAKATATGVVTVTRGAAGQVKLAGQLNIDHADISAINRTPPGVVGLDVIERNRPFGEDEAAPPPTGREPAITLDIKLRAGKGVFLKGLGLNAEMSLDADVAGTTAAPELRGTARVQRGVYDFAGKRFDIDDSSVVYLDSSLDRIRLDLSARRDDPTLTAVINIKGTAAKPEITLTSSPTLPSDEVLSQVLFGKSAAQLSGIEAAQLAAAVTTLATGGGFDVMGGLRNFARLDRLALGADTLGAPTVSGGKYISDKVYLELTGGGRQGPSAQIEVRAGRGLSILSQVGGVEGAKLAVRWRLDYGKAKTPRGVK